MKIILTEEKLKKELTQKQYEKFKETRNEYGELSAIRQLPEMQEHKGQLFSFVNSRIKQLRKENGLTQADLGNVLGVSQRVYWRYEQEGYSINILRLAHIAIFYNVSIDWFSGYCDVRKPFFEGEGKTMVNGYVLQELKEAKAKGIEYEPHKLF